MPVTLALLRGPVAKYPLTSFPYVFTRKKKRASIMPRPRDHSAWRWNGNALPEFVVRSLINPEDWITIPERDSMMVELLAAGWAFKSPKSKTMVAPLPAAIGWLKLNGDSRRFKHQHSDFGWNRIFAHRDDGC